jgi:hypothetical protein
MRSGVWLWSFAGLVFPACAGDYPLEATPCDDYCHATEDLQCDFYDPARCVEQCERDMKGSEACRMQLNAVIACFVNTPNAAEERCNLYGFVDSFGADPTPCASELSLLTECTNRLHANDPQR